MTKRPPAHAWLDDALTEVCEYLIDKGYREADAQLFTQTIDELARIDKEKPVKERGSCHYFLSYKTSGINSSVKKARDLFYEILEDRGLRNPVKETQSVLYERSPRLSVIQIEINSNPEAELMQNHFYDFLKSIKVRLVRTVKVCDNTYDLEIWHVQPLKKITDILRTAGSWLLGIKAKPPKMIGRKDIRLAKTLVNV